MTNFGRGRVVLTTIVFNLFISSVALADLSCDALLIPARADWSERPNVRQCQGTCYFEASMALIETHMTQKLEKPVSLSRLHYFAKHLERNARLFLVQRGKFQAGRRGRKKQKKDIGYIDVVSGGSHVQGTISAITGIVLYPQRSQSEIYLENKRIEELFLEVGDLLYRFKQILRSGLDEDDLIQAVREYSEELSRIVDPVIQREEAKGLEAGIWDNEGVDLSVMRMSDVQDELPDSHSWDDDLKERIIRKLDSGDELYLAYYHVFRYASDIPGQKGLMKLPDNADPVEPGSIASGNGGPHGVPVIGYALDENGKLDYLVVRNSWGYGKDKSDRGHHYVSNEYLSKYFIEMSLITEAESGPLTKGFLGKFFD